MISLTIDVGPGERIDRAAECAVRLATKLEVSVRFSFDGIELYARPFESPVSVAARYGDACRKRPAESMRPERRRAAWLTRWFRGEGDR